MELNRSPEKTIGDRWIATWSDSTGTALRKPDGTTAAVGVTGITNVAVVASNTAAANGTIIATAMASATEGSTLQFPEGTFNTTTITLAKVFIWRGVGRQATVLNAPSGNLIDLTGSTTGVGMRLESMSLRSAAGHVVNQTGRLSGFSMVDCYLKTSGTNKSCWIVSGAALLLDALWEQSELDQNGTGGPLFSSILAGGNFNTCTFRRMRINAQGLTTPAMYFECTGAGNYVHDISFYDLNFEEATYGSIHGYGANNFLIIGCKAYDTITFQDDVFKFGQTTGEASSGITIIASGRNSGALAGGKYDVNDTAASSVFVLNSTAPGFFLSTTRKTASIEQEKFIPGTNISNTHANASDADTNMNQGSWDVLTYNDPLTAARTVNFSSTNILTGQKFKIVRTANCTGAFGLNVGGFVTLNFPGWVEVMYSSSIGAFVLLDSGLLNPLGTAQTIAFNATTMLVNFALGTEVSFGTLSANVTAMSAPSNIPIAGTICRFYMLQDGTGGRTFTWHNKFTGTTWPVGSGTANQRQVVTGISNGTNIVFQSSSGWFTPT